MGDVACVIPFAFTDKLAFQGLLCYTLCFPCLILSGAHYCLVLIFHVYLVLPAFTAYRTLTQDYRDLGT